MPDLEAHAGPARREIAEKCTAVPAGAAGADRVRQAAWTAQPAFRFRHFGLIALLACLVTPEVSAWPWPAEDIITLRVLPDAQWTNDRSPFAKPGSDRELAMRADLLWHHRNDLFTLKWTGTSSLVEGEGTTSRGVLNELFIDRAVGDLDLTLGKKIMTYGVGHAMRPLDVIQRERTLPLQPLVLEGVPVAAVEYYTADSSFSAIYIHREDADREPYRGRDSEAALRAAFTRGLWDFHTLAHYGEATGWSLGTDFATVSGKSLAFYGGLLWQQKHRLLRAMPPDASWSSPNPGAPVLGWSEEGSAIKAVAGLTYTWDSGFTLITELSYNGAARSDGQWRDILQLASARREALSGHGGVPGASDPILNQLAWGLAQPSPVRQGVLAQFGYDGDRIDPYIQIFHSPDAGGGFVTAHLDFELRNRHTISVGARRYFGGSGSPFGALPVDNQVYAGWEWAFDVGRR